MSINLRVLIFQESSGNQTFWIGQALEKDIAVQSRTLSGLRTAMGKILKAHIFLALERGRMPFAHLKKAPQKFFDAYERAATKLNGIPLSMSRNQLPKRPDFPRSRLPHGEALMRVAEFV